MLRVVPPHGLSRMWRSWVAVLLSHDHDVAHLPMECVGFQPHVQIPSARLNAAPRTMNFSNPFPPRWPVSHSQYIRPPQSVIPGSTRTTCAHMARRIVMGLFIPIDAYMKKVSICERCAMSRIWKGKNAEHFSCFLVIVR